MDQLVSIGVEFDSASLRRAIHDTEAYYRSHPSAAQLPTKEAPKPKGQPPKIIAMATNAIPDSIKKSAAKATKVTPTTYFKWAVDPILQGNHPLRPWGAGAILRAHSPMYTLAGTITRTPGMYHKLNSYNGKELPEYLEDTGEMIHPSVRIRLAVKGLGYDDKKQWNAAALTNAGWELAKKTGGDWCWVYEGKENLPKKVLEESELGTYEKKMLELAGGYPDIVEYVNNMSLEEFQGMTKRKPSVVPVPVVPSD
jgi:hypothetical protein